MTLQQVGRHFSLIVWFSEFFGVLRMENKEDILDALDGIKSILVPNYVNCLQLIFYNK